MRKIENQAEVDALEALTPKQWNDRLGMVSDPDVRKRVACIIWWDYFADDHLMKDMKKLGMPVDTMWAYDVPPSTLQRALLTVGYPTQWAEDRSRVNVSGQEKDRVCVPS